MNFFLVAAAIATISITITQSILFKPLRKRLPFFNCPYCLNHYLAIIGALILPWFEFLDFIITTLALVLMATIFSYPVLLVFKELENES